MASGPRVSIRLGTDGKAQVQQDFADIATSGTAHAQRLSAAYEKALADAGAAIERQAKAAQRLMAVGAINPTTGAGYDQSAKSAASSAAIFTKELERQEAEAKRLIASIDPLFAAQMRYAENVQRINAVKATGQLTEEQYLKLLAVEETQLNQATAAGVRHAGVQGQMRMGMQQLGFQLGDISTQWAMGTRASVIFAQQSGQVIQAFQLMGGEGNKVLEFLRGPWGIALSVAAIALTPLIGKLFETEETLDDMVEKLKKEADQSAKNDEAHRAFENTLEGVTEALKKNRDALKGMEDAGRTAAEQALRHATAEAVRLSEIRLTTIGLIAQAKAEIELNRARAQVAGMDPRVAGPVLADADAAEQRLNALESTLPGLNAQMVEAQRQITEAFSHISVDDASRDAVEQIKRRYEGPDGLIEQARKRAVAEGKVGDELERQVKLLKDQEAEKIKAAQANDRNGANAERAGGTTIGNAQIAAFFDIAAKYRGKSETADKAVLESFFRAANENLDPEKTAWCAAFVNAVLATGGVKGTGSLAARSFLNFGKDDMSSPQKGDIVIVRSGASPSGTHVGFLDSIDAKGNVSVLGGNTGNKVGTATFAASQVLGIRRPPTPGESYAADLKQSEDAADAAVREYMQHLAKTVPAQIKEAARPIDELMAATKHVTEFDQQHQQTMALLQQELGLAGQSNQAREEGVRLLQLEYDLRKQFPGMTQEMIDKILQQTAAEDALRDHIAQVEQSMDDARRIGDQLVDDVLDPQNWGNWRDMGLKALHDLEEAMFRLAVINPLKNLLFGENNSTLGSILSAVFKIGGAVAGGSGGSTDFGTSAVDAFDPIASSIAPGNAAGDAYFPGGLTWVGEHGKELVRLPRGSRITPAGESRRLAAANDAGIGSLYMPITIDATGADQAAIARLNAKIDELRAELPARVVEAYADARQRNVIRN